MIGTLSAPLCICIMHFIALGAALAAAHWASTCAVLLGLLLLQAAVAPAVRKKEEANRGIAVVACALLPSLELITCLS
jgi:hypothetical protein